MRQPCESVSVVIPVYNGVSYVGAAIESVLAQWGSAVQVAQVIVVDNDSTDGTWETVERLVAARGDDRVMLIREKRPNAANARNAGARLATGAWLAFLDADDLWLAGKLQRQMEARKEHPEAELLFTLGAEFHSAELGWEERGRFLCRPEPYLMRAPSSLLLRSESFMQVGDLPDVASGEFIAWYGWARELGLKDYVVPEVLVKRRIHARNSTRADRATAGYPMAAKWLLDRRREARLRTQATL